jgi:hypothetical protein
MAKIVNDSALGELRHAFKYPWDEWFDGQTREMVPGEDFFTGAATFRNTFGTAARQRGLLAQTRITGDNRVIARAVKRETP